MLIQIPLHPEAPLYPQSPLPYFFPCQHPKGWTCSSWMPTFPDVILSFVTASFPLHVEKKSCLTSGHLRVPVAGLEESTAPSTQTQLLLLTYFIPLLQSKQKEKTDKTYGHLQQQLEVPSAAPLDPAASVTL